MEDILIKLAFIILLTVPLTAYSAGASIEQQYQMQLQMDQYNANLHEQQELELMRQQQRDQERERTMQRLEQSRGNIIPYMLPPLGY